MYLYKFTLNTRRQRQLSDPDRADALPGRQAPSFLRKGACHARLSSLFTLSPSRLPTAGRPVSSCCCRKPPKFTGAKPSCPTLACFPTTIKPLTNERRTPCNSIKNSFFKSRVITLGSSSPEKKSRNFATWGRIRCGGSEMRRTAPSATINAAPSGLRNGCRITPNFNKPRRLRLSIYRIVNDARKP